MKEDAPCIFAVFHLEQESKWFFVSRSTVPLDVWNAGIDKFRFARGLFLHRLPGERHPKSIQAKENIRTRTGRGGIVVHNINAVPQVKATRSDSLSIRRKPYDF